MLTISINLVIVSTTHLYSFTIALCSYSYHIGVIDIRSYNKDPTPLTLAKHHSYSEDHSW